jgi:protein O-mannosyl-transferase
MKAKSTQPQSIPNPSSEWMNPKILIGLTAVLSIIAFYPAFQNGFVWDDTPYVTENPYLRKFTTEMFQTYWMGNYHPLTMLSLFIDFSIAETEPLWYHIHNLLLHLGSSLIIGFLLSRYTQSNLNGWLGALLYAVHPIHVESVAWISERKDLLYGFYYFAALLSWDEFRKSGNGKYQLLTLLLFILSCFGKGMAVTLPAVIVLLDFFHYKKSIPVIIKDTAAGFIVSLIFGYIAINAQKESSAMREGEYYSLLDHAAIGFTGWFHYLLKLLVPHPLSAVYTMPLKDPRTMLFPNIFYFALVAFPLLLALILWKGNAKIKLLILAFSASVAHVLFAPVGSAMAADRYMYVPSLFFCWGIVELLSNTNKKVSSQFRKTLFQAILFLGVPALTWLSIQRTQVWVDNFTLFSDVAKQYPHDLLANNNIGLHYVKAKEFDKAREAYNRVIKHYPMDYTGYFNMGVSYNLQEKGREAMYYFFKVQELNPGYKDLNAQLGVAALFARANDTAVVILEKALQQNPDIPDNYFNLALAYSRVGKLDESDEMYIKGMKMDSTRINSYLNRAYNARKRNDFSGEKEWIEKAVTAGMERGSALRNTGIMIGEDLDYEGAKYYFEQAVILDSTDAEAWYNLGISYEKSGNLNTAIPIYVKAAQLDYAAAKELLDRNKVPY